MEINECFDQCHKRFGVMDPGRVYCKKGCDSEEKELESCKTATCEEMCFKKELGDDDNKLGSWSKVLARAPADPSQCMDSCIYGCNNRELEEDEEASKGGVLADNLAKKSQDDDK